MCNLYVPDHPENFEKFWRMPAPEGIWGPYVAPLKPGPFITGAKGALVGQWGMIPAHSHTRLPSLPNGRRLSTNNARRERMATAPTYRDAWRTGRRCLIPALSFDEPYWGTGKSIAWRFKRVDGNPWALAGLWSEWTDPETGEVVPNFTMITQNADAHPLLKLMHKPDPKFAADKQDKRAVVPIEEADWEQWLLGSVDQASELIKLPGLEKISHGAVDSAKQVDLGV